MHWLKNFVLFSNEKSLICALKIWVCPFYLEKLEK